MEQPLRILYMGTPDFAVPALNALVDNGYNVVAVITAPDKPAGRGLKIQLSPVKEAALIHAIPVLQPTNLKDPNFISELKSYKATLQIVVAFRMLPELVWNMPSLGTFNLHASILPQYRGAAPINWAIMNGEKETGITTFFLQHIIDTGDILFIEKEPIEDEDTFETLYNKLKEKGASLIVKTVKAIETSSIRPSPQQFTDELKPAPKIHKETCQLDWSREASQLRNFIRGLSPYPAAWTILKGKTLKVYKANVVEGIPQQSSGTTETDSKTYLYFHTGNGVLSLVDLQLEGKKRMGIEEFLRGYKF